MISNLEEQVSKESTTNLSLLNDIEIFEAGTYDGLNISVDNIDQMVNNFHLLKDKIKPPLVLGHDEHQTLLNNSGLPAGGWLSELKRTGNKLIASFTDVPKTLAELIKKRAYKRISSEIYRQYKEGEQNLGTVLKRVALLGADIPRIKTLQDVAALYSEGDQEHLVINYEVFTEKGEIMPENQKQDVKMYSEDDYMVVVKQKDSLLKENEQLKTEIFTEKQKQIKSDISVVIDSLKKEGKWIPAYEKTGILDVWSTLNDGIYKFSEGDKTIEKSHFDVIKDFVSMLPVVIKFDETAKVSTEKEPEPIITNKYDEFYAKVSEKVEKEKLSFSEARKAIMDENPEYAKLYYVKKEE